MKLKKYIRDKLLSIIFCLLLLIVETLIMLAFKSPNSMMIAIIFISILIYTFLFSYDYLKRRAFYQELFFNLKSLDQKYLISELLPNSTFLEAKYVEEILYQANKSMREKINQYKLGIDDFKEYIELWIHEVKIPLASLHLILHNHQTAINNSLVEQISRVENNVEQVLYYARSENVEQDYLIKKCQLNEVINKVIVKNKQSFICQKIKVDIKDANQIILSDSKWLEYIINQIIQNSLKYFDKKNSRILFSTNVSENYTELVIEDNGIGISASDLPRVFDKSFTGKNGRNHSASTGMGLYIVKRLIDKLGHQIKIESKEKEFTKVTITFFENKYYDVL